MTDHLKQTRRHARTVLAFNKDKFYADLRSHLDTTRRMVIEGKTPNQVDTCRIFEAADHACENQKSYFPENGESFWNSYPQHEAGSKREFLCDYTYQDEYGRILLAL